VVSRSALLKGGYGTRRGVLRKQSSPNGSTPVADASCRRCLGMRSSLNKVSLGNIHLGCGVEMRQMHALMGGIESLVDFQE
jgi:hypothetical protein